MLLQIFQRKCNEVFAEIQLAIQETYYGPHASLFVRNAIQYIKLRCHTRLGHGGHLDFNRIQDSIFLNNQVDLPINFNRLPAFVLLFLIPAIIVIHVEIVLQSLVGIRL